MSHFCCSEDHRRSSANWQQLEEGRRRESIVSGDFLGPVMLILHFQPSNSSFLSLHITYRWPGPSHQPDLLRPTPGKLHQRNLRGKVQVLDVHLISLISEEGALVREPLPDMNSNRMSLSSFLEFLSLRTRLMGTLVLAAAGSYSEIIRRA